MKINNDVENMLDNQLNVGFQMKRFGFAMVVIV